MHRPRMILAPLLGCMVSAGCGQAGGSAEPAPLEADESGPAAVPWFADEAAERGLVFVHSSGAAGRYFLPETTAGGAALFDMDGDGDLDAYLVQAGSLVRPGTRAGNQLFRNVGGGRFEDVTAASGAGDSG